MPAPSAHLPAETLEQLAEGNLPRGVAAEVAAHLNVCGRCSAELESIETLFQMLGELSRFAPAPGFDDAVMARVSITPQESRAVAWLQRALPSTRRGWAMASAVVVIPSVPLIAFVVWLLSHPLLSPAILSQWGLLRVHSLTQAGLAWVIEGAVDSRLLEFVQAAYATLEAVPISTLTGAITGLALAIPISAWALVRLTRTPSGSRHYAN